jgi:hypothetical protein
MEDQEEIDRLERELHELDEQIAKLRQEIVWRKREIRPGYEPIGIAELDQQFLELSDKFTETWRRWSKAHKL